ncbi:carbonic anhydrase [Aedes aegypti]|uniref:Carbonic anhydrase n=1 Tax=Aedes aegypti TaxID=7159 RepID=A0A1S4FM64_AEDAE|nr:carbonic anhydrase [Aedes aegypti]
MADNRVNGCFLLTVFGLALLPLICDADTWHYPKPKPDGTVGNPEHWGGSCDTGRRQSPIDLNMKAAVKGAYPQFVFDNYDQVMRNASLVNNGHTIQVYAGEVSASVYGGGLRNKYILEQFHFHWSSEHTIADQRYALEVHLVHRNSKYASLTDAAAEKGGVAVLAVLFHVDEQPNDAIKTILDVVTPVKDKVNDYVRLAGVFALENLLPKSRSKYFRYEGSLTTPLCAESVVWTIFPESLPVSLAQLEEFKTIRDGEHEELVLNYRPVQPLNARALVWVSDTEQRADGGSSFLRANSISMTAGLLLSIVICYFRT